MQTCGSGGGCEEGDGGLEGKVHMRCKRRQKTSGLEMQDFNSSLTKKL